MSHPAGQRGNILFMILLAVLLFGALSYAISRSNTGVAESRSEKLDTEFSKYASIMNLATTEFTRLTVYGCALSDIPDVSTASVSPNPKCNFFARQGGRFSYASDGIPPIRLNKISLPGNGTSADDAVVVINIGNTTNIKNICDRINEKNGIVYIQNPGANFWSSNVKSFADSDGNDSSSWPSAFDGKSQGCTFDTSLNTYVMYGTVQER